jgi:hypothetical protein
MFKLKINIYGNKFPFEAMITLGNKSPQFTIMSFTRFYNINKQFSTKAKLDPFLILEVNRQADWKTIKQAYFRLARLYHPDLNKSDEVSENQLSIINNQL